MFSLRSLRIKAMQYLFAHLIQRRTADTQTKSSFLSAFDKRKIRTSLSDSVQKIHHLHTTFLALMTSWALIERQRADRRLEPIPTPLSQDALLNSLASHPTFTILCQQYPTLFSLEQIERWYYDYTHSPSSITTVSSEPTDPNQPSCMLALLKHCFQEEMIQTEVAKEDIFWHEDRVILYQRLRRFIKQFAKDPDKAFALYQTSPSSLKSDFYTQLIAKTLTLLDAHHALLSKQAANWRVERINLLDQIMIHMALTEIFHCPDIPKKVSINEYLEIAKQYSTPKSAAFINGIVDSITQAEDISPSS